MSHARVIELAHADGPVRIIIEAPTARIADYLKPSTLARFTPAPAPAGSRPQTMDEILSGIGGFHFGTRKG